MKAQSHRQFSLKAMQALVVFVALTGGARAGSIVQTINFYDSYGYSSLPGYQLFDPNLGILESVGISVSGSASLGSAAFENFSTETISFNAYVSFTVLYPVFDENAGSQQIENVYPTTLAPGNITFESASGGFGFGTIFRSDLSGWIGTGYVFPNVEVESLQASADNPNIFVDLDLPPFLQSFQLIGSETVTYTYVVPEPTSLLMFGTAVFILAGAVIKHTRKVGSRT